jgi:hypothetical protein
MPTGRPMRAGHRVLLREWRPSFGLHLGARKTLRFLAVDRRSLPYHRPAQAGAGLTGAVPEEAPRECLAALLDFLPRTPGHAGRRGA